MNTRPLNPQESKNLTALNQAGCNSVLVFLTETGLNKSILDATEPMRRLLRHSGVHDFSLQSQGQENKVLRPALILTDTGLTSTSVSLYRPTTKHGDPRLWFYEFRLYAKLNDVCAVFIRDQIIHLLNLTQSSIFILLAQHVINSSTQFLENLSTANQAPAQELLASLRLIAKAGPIKSECVGDMAVGRSIETALGITANSRRSPDFKGIEIKTGRSAALASKETRATLFACVPDWDLSKLKSSRAILEKFGYQRGDNFKLYCTLSAVKTNSRGLQLEVRDVEKHLREFFANEPVDEVCIWRLDRLHSRLAEKHRETFWVKAKATKCGSNEWFQLESVTHTTRPSLEHFDRFLIDGTVTMDHLIKRKPNQSVSEKGPLFKIERARIPELFLGEPRHYSLLL